MCNNFEQCQEAEQHQPECKGFQSIGSLAGRALTMELLSDIAFLHEIVLVLRCLSLRATNVTGWLNLTSLQSHLEMREETELGLRGEHVAKFVSQRFVNVLHQYTHLRVIKRLPKTMITEQIYDIAHDEIGFQMLE